ncbi:MAG: YebC/PmpR family DNA-binding transcriptional regulator [Candidatus Sumerlaeota bacterium]|nr:YebC/PmpR family DNA-binding transcriptional regulator [Candidatus Sumerlaeota bacterium]
MSGHSKWHSIKHKKAALDAKRGQKFTKVIRELVVAARMAGSDPNNNPRLRVAITAARDINMPKDTIERNIKKGAGEIGGAAFEDVTYEGYGPGGVAILAECSTDNKNRTAASIRHVFSRFNGSLGASGCVAYLFKKKGMIVVKAEGANEDAAMEAALDAGAEDFSNDGETFTVTTSYGDLMKVREALEKKGFAIESSEVQNIANTTVKVEGRDAETLMKLLNALEDEEDISNVSANFEMDEAVLAKLAE